MMNACRCWCCLEPVPLEAEGQSQGQPLGSRGMLLEAMLRYCFDIHIKPSDSDRIICNLCIHKLRESCSFRNQVEEAQWRLSVAVDETNVKSEPAMEYLSEMDTPSSPETYEKVDDEDAIHFKTPRRRITKRAKKTRTITLKKEEKYSCKICTATFDSEEEQTLHSSLCRTKHICHACGKSHTSKEALGKHLRSHEAKVLCLVCGKHVSKTNQHQHQKTHEGIPIYTCVECPQRFRYHDLRQRHMAEVHGYVRREYPCSLCSETFKNASRRASHFRNRHRMERKHACKECDKAFFDKTGLRNHMLVHTGERPFECDICHKRYGKKYTLTEHLKIHYNIKNFKCAVCGTSFTQKCTLVGHLKTHQNK